MGSGCSFVWGAGRPRPCSGTRGRRAVSRTTRKTTWKAGEPPDSGALGPGRGPDDLSWDGRHSVPRKRFWKRYRGGVDRTPLQAESTAERAADRVSVCCSECVQVGTWDADRPARTPEEGQSPGRVVLLGRSHRLVQAKHLGGRGQPAGGGSSTNSREKGNAEARGHPRRANVAANEISEGQGRGQRGSPGGSQRRKGLWGGVPLGGPAHGATGGKEKFQGKGITKSVRSNI